MVKIKRLIQQDQQQNVMSMTVRNNQTGNDISVRSALSYDKTSTVYKSAKKLIDKHLYHNTKYTDDILNGKFKSINRNKQIEYIDKLNKKAQKYIEQVQLQKYNSNLSQEEENAIDVYTSVQYKNINNYLRLGQQKNPKYDKIVNQVKTAMSKNKLQHDIVTYRGISSADFIPKQGQVFQEKGFVSTSPHIYNAYSFATGKNPYMVKMNIKKDTPAVYIGGGQKQLLLSSDAKFKVVKVDHNKRFIHLESV